MPRQPEICVKRTISTSYFETVKGDEGRMIVDHDLKRAVIFFGDGDDEMCWGDWHCESNDPEEVLRGYVVADPKYTLAGRVLIVTTDGHEHIGTAGKTSTSLCRAGFCPPLHMQNVKAQLNRLANCVSRNSWAFVVIPE